ncbi:MAG: hypothetical protein ACRC33_22900 [Gemmataceae bacterium]
MTSEELTERAKQRPFLPFHVVLTTGEEILVRHPDLIMVGRRSVTIGVVNDSAGTVYDRSCLIDLFHVVCVRELPPAPPPGTNGAGTASG